MVDPRQAYHKAREAHVQQKCEAEDQAKRQKEALSSAYARNIVEAKKLVSMFNNYADIFKKNKIHYGFADERPKQPMLRVCLFKTNESNSPKLTQIIIGTKSKLFSLVPIVRVTNEDEYSITRKYEGTPIGLSDDANDAASEIMRLIGTRELKFDHLWDRDHVPKYVGNYFAKKAVGRVVAGAGVVIGVAVMALLARALMAP